MPKDVSDKDGFDHIPFRMHPRVFAALGADLVTNDVVAVIELVKNSYDAFANNVWVRFGSDPKEGNFLEIEDDGIGMSRAVIEDVWCVVATPYKEDNKFVKSGKKKRRVAGEKGLGRLSAARLGGSLHIITQSINSDCSEVTVDWSDLAKGDDMSSCFAKCRKYLGRSPFKSSGTRLRIFGLDDQWDEDRILDLEENLARLISPFTDLGDFKVFLSYLADTETGKVEIESPKFLLEPKYSINGKVNTKGEITCTYNFNHITDNSNRSKPLTLSWENVYDAMKKSDRSRFPFKKNKIKCGPFSFEIRAWDIGSDDTQEIAERFDLKKSLVRKAIRAHKGISVYRDDILVLPKSDNARDWLGLDLRRISKVGTRLSTSQIVGYVSISADKNPKIDDTSGRESLADCLEVAEFEALLKAIIALLENERDEDRVKVDREKPMNDLFNKISAKKILADTMDLANEGAEASDVIPLLHAHDTDLDATRETIQERFVYYSRLATVGTIAQMLVHEIRNRTTVLGRFLKFIFSEFSPFEDKNFKNEYRHADNTVDTLELLADKFAPLANRSFKRRKRDTILEECIKDSLDLLRGEIKGKKVIISVPKTETRVAVDPGELDAILLNLITNALYWLGQTPIDDRKLEFKQMKANNGKRVRVSVHDSGPGLNEEDIEKVFWPGVTEKPDGIGMGLTVASELVSEYGGRMSTQHPGKLGGASFIFDLPLKLK